MKKSYFLVVAFLLSALMTVSIACADYAYTEYDTAPVGGRVFIIRNGISDNRRSAYAKTNGGTNTYNTVSADFYFLNYTTHQAGSYLNYESAGSISAMVNAPTLDYQQNVKYYEVFSNHGGTYNDSSFRHNGLRTLVD